MFDRAELAVESSPVGEALMDIFVMDSAAADDTITMEDAETSVSEHPLVIQGSAEQARTTRRRGGGRRGRR